MTLAALGAGCGNERTPVPDVVTPDPPRGTRVVEIRAAGVRFSAPFNWPDLQPQGQRVGGIQNKRATLAVWRYPRTEPLPRTAAELREARRLLIERVKRRDPTFVLRSSRTLRRGGARTIELVGRQTVAGLPFEVRSAHVFHAGAEIVVDAFAPPEHFARVDRTVFAPLLDTLKLSEPRT